MSVFCFSCLIIVYTPSHVCLRLFSLIFPSILCLYLCLHLMTNCLISFCIILTCLLLPCWKACFFLHLSIWKNLNTCCWYNMLHTKVCIVCYHSVELIRVDTGIYEYVLWCIVKASFQAIHCFIIPCVDSSHFRLVDLKLLFIQRDQVNSVVIWVTQWWFWILPVCFLCFYVTKAQVKCLLFSNGPSNILLKMGQYMFYGMAIEIPQYTLRSIRRSIFQLNCIVTYHICSSPNICFWMNVDSSNK